MGQARVFIILCVFAVLVDFSRGEQRKYTLPLNLTWTPTQNIYLVSPDGTFAAGFYSVTAKDYALAVWYAKIAERTVVWMANGDNLVGAESSLHLGENGNLTLADSNGTIVWATNSSVRNASNLALLSTGNLVLNKANGDGYVWQSFDFPTDTLLPSQIFTGQSRLRSRRSKDSYASGNFFLDMETTNFILSLYYSKGSGEDKDVYWPVDSSPLKLQGSSNISLNDTGYFRASHDNAAMASDRGEPRWRRMTLDFDGNLRMYSHSKNSSSSVWDVVWVAVQEQCTVHGFCGQNAICIDEGEPKCICPPGFRPNGTDHPLSCQRNQPLGCGPRWTKFITLDYVNFSGGSNQTDRNARTLEECQTPCMDSCNCLGFAYKLDGTGYCVHQIGKLLNGYWSPEAETIMYLKVSINESEKSNLTGMLAVLNNVCPVNLSLPIPAKFVDHTTRDLIIICLLFGLELFCGVFAFCAFLRKYSKYLEIARVFGLEFLTSGGPKRFTYAELKAATNNFSDLLGRGGFGLVYRGLLPDQRMIAVKKLQGLSQGEQEFWAEVTIIGRIHHLNLVRMWGFCADGEHRLLVYEFIPNGSLDRYLFHNEEEESVPNWNTRYRIAVGVARAIAYLHEECLEWILHCDIKPENILLDESFCPKVSDFGLAKLVEKERSLNVSTIRGTRGYLAPEWMSQQPITAKADVYSFGMVLLEIVSGRRNVRVGDSTLQSEGWYFPHFAFEKVVLERRAEEIVDGRLRGLANDRVQLEAVDRMVKTALWCIQGDPDHRPSMGKVAKMLEGLLEVPQPPKPTTFFDEDENRSVSMASDFEIISSG